MVASVCESCVSSFAVIVQPKAAALLFTRDGLFGPRDGDDEWVAGDEPIQRDLRQGPVVRLCDLVHGFEQGLEFFAVHLVGL
jgi:hypothetical protein